MWKLNTNNTDLSVSLKPVKISWNDFGFNYHSEITFVVNNQPLSIKAFSIPLLNKREVLLSLEDAQSKEPESLEFFCIFKSQDEYIRLYDFVGEQNYENALRVVNDLRLTRIEAPHLYNYITELDNFKLGVLRSFSAFKVYESKHTSQIEKPLNDSRIDFTYSAKLEGFENNHQVNFEYKDMPYFQDRIQCLIGMNGTGKSNYLNNLILSTVLNNNISFPDTLVSIGSIERKIKDWPKLGIEENQNIPKITKVLAYTSDTESPFPREVWHSRGLEYKFFNVSQSSLFETNSEARLSYLIGYILRDELEWSYKDQEDSIYTILEKCLEGIIPFQEIILPVKPSIFHLGKLIQKKDGDWIQLGQISGEQRTLEILSSIDTSREIAFYRNNKVIPLSSGHRSFFRFAIHFLCNASIGSLVIIDEPETHFHPNLISHFMSLLYRILERKKSVAIIATHSAYIVREVPAHCVHIFRRTDNLINTDKVYMKTLGASVNEISNFIFGDSMVKTYHEKVSEAIAESGMSFEEALKNYSTVANIDLLSDIREKINNQK